MLKTKKLPLELSEALSSTEWSPVFKKWILPPFKMGKTKHNNKTKVNVRGSRTVTYKSLGRYIWPPEYYECLFVNEKEAEIIQKTIRDYGICVPIISQSEDDIRIQIDLGDAFRLVSLVNPNSK